ncbi:hypothetical protein ZWY2020_002364 [Hordeum vulgare]|nr:hypothetical protein ZWY2020_002364 [Hordeum vulgare]
MVSWSYGESTKGSDLQFLASYDSPIENLGTIDDPLYTRATDDLGVMCKHGKPRKKCVAFEGINTGNRFVARVVEGVNNCELVHWVDEERLDHLQNALHKLWLMYEESKHDNRIACLEHSPALHNIIEQKNKLQKTYEKLVEDVNNLLYS